MVNNLVGWKIEDMCPQSDLLVYTVYKGFF